MKNLIHNHWDEILGPVFDSPRYRQLHDFLKQEYRTKIIYPEMHHIFTAFQLTDFADVKVVILGQDPYHNPGQAHGLSFSVLPGAPIPPSLRNIYKELMTDVQFKPVQHGYLADWAKQGVLLLNAVLTVPAGHANGHAGKGWEQVTDAAIGALSARGHVVFILWGSYAQKKIPLIDQTRNFILRSVHPSPLSASRGFFGTRPFSKTNEFLKSWGVTPIDWQLPAKVTALDERKN
ncbi:uracil-DNA glycosylase [Amylolactobacillus amylotrophicus DSM 20534]|uniref:Uracil-DNA glycosylase n=3 Tax=Amylolactobacillus TaxID=2767876 RepID=A0A1L6XDD8_9LACO|nr:MULTISPECIES: uracil-DNA glycosylase [Amylolactobacillus]APT18983.1 uracil-DNA glycosylase [Amylolactobacillus amylophilus DSM 20533 = JCM 1125]KRK38755.1 uracil-DNA glycosylase [Amylolactobacillus amylotrophicus DSM 20534]KRM42602.1 uracil-DNA glycosylase [Amylolactobacillus amylophilus DSM 20533 = JCM 1125]GED79975.1 uracil-DNA glycosylase [Amylolactobacillus amylophilus]